MNILGATRIASNYANAATLKTYGNKFDNPKTFNDPKNAPWLNRQEILIQEQHFLQLFTARYTWKSDNENMPVNYIEYLLFYNGLLAFFYHKDFGYMLLPCTINVVNWYGEPESVTVTIPYNTNVPLTINKGDFVLLKDNFAFNVPFITVQHYCRKIADLNRTVEVYSRGMKKPLIIAGEFNTAKSRQQLISNIQENETAIVVDLKNISGFSGHNILQNTSHKGEDLKTLYHHKQNIYHECLNQLGITTPTVLKNAQQNNEEINKNDTLANIILEGTYKCREDATRQIYEFSGISLTCELATDLTPSVDDELKPKE